MAELFVERTVAASAERTFAVLSDIEGAPAHQPAIVRVEMLTPGPFGVGTRWRETRKAMGTQATVELSVTAFEPGVMYRVEAMMGRTRYITDVRVTPTGPGTCVASFRVRAEAATLLGRIAARLMMPAMRRAMRDDLATVTRAVEGG
jgi:hypothetical protein